MTWLANSEQGPAASPSEYPGTDNTVMHSEGLLIGYRWYNAKDQTPLYPFGYGLSCTSFRLGKSAVRKAGNGTIRVSVPVTNTGKQASAAVVQACVTYPSPADEPRQQEKAEYGADHDEDPGTSRWSQSAHRPDPHARQVPRPRSLPRRPQPASPAARSRVKDGISPDRARESRDKGNGDSRERGVRVVRGTGRSSRGRLAGL